MIDPRSRPIYMPRPRNDAEPRRRRPYDYPIWRKLRPVIFARDNYECRVRLPGCTGRAEVVDHIQPWLAGGKWFDLNNLRASCDHCNVARSNKVKAGDPAPLPPSREW